MEENTEKNSICIGLTGGFGTGKTTVASFIADKGYKVIPTDDMAKEIMIADESVKQKLTNEFGREIYLEDGEINRSMLASIVFTDSPEAKNKLRKLDMIVHPPVIDEMIKQVEALEKSGETLIFVESALIFEAGLEEGFDYIITVDSKVEVIAKRAEKRGYTPEQAEQRLKGQMSLQEKRNRADFVIENNGNEEDLKNSTNAILEIIEAILP